MGVNQIIPGKRAQEQERTPAPAVREKLRRRALRIRIRPSLQTYGNCADPVSCVSWEAKLPDAPVENDEMPLRPKENPRLAFQGLGFERRGNGVKGSGTEGERGSGDILSKYGGRWA